MPHVSYPNPLCPWPGCGFEFGYVDFRLELVDQDLYQRGLQAWHKGLSLVGRCPGCSALVAFSDKGLSQGAPADLYSVFLPEDWYEHALFLDASGNLIIL